MEKITKGKLDEAIEIAITGERLHVIPKGTPADQIDRLPGLLHVIMSGDPTDDVRYQGSPKLLQLLASMDTHRATYYALGGSS